MKRTAALRNLTLAALASLSLGGCYYGDVYGASYADADCYSRYGDQYWGNEPFAYDDGYYGYDCYDAADYRSGFVQIGFGGGWHQQLYYPGHGMYLFDRYGRRHAMSHDYLTYWGGRRAWWKHHGHRYRDGYNGPGRDDRQHDGRRPGRGYGDSNWRNGPGATPVPGERPRGERPRRDWRNAPGAAPSPGAGPDAGAPPFPGERPRGDGGQGRPRGDGDGGGGGGGRTWTPPTSVDSPPPRPERDQPRYSAPAPIVEADRPMPQRIAPPPQNDPEPPSFRRAMGEGVKDE